MRRFYCGNRTGVDSRPVHVEKSLWLLQEAYGRAGITKKIWTMSSFRAKSDKMDEIAKHIDNDGYAGAVFYEQRLLSEARFPYK